MRIKLFGTPSVWDGERQVGGALAQRRRLALVVVLAAGAPPGRPALPRARILELLWPGDDEERARAALSQALYAVRRNLGADDAIVGSADLRLNPERVSCDYWEFLASVIEGADSAAAELRTAPLLEDFDVPEAPAFEPWAYEVAQETDRQWSRAAVRAAERAERAADLERAVRLRRALANADPLDSGTAVALARVLALAGNREAALRHLRVHTTLVEQELEATPAPQVVELTERLQRGEVPTAEPAAAVTAAALSAPVAPVPSVAPAASVAPVAPVAPEAIDAPSGPEPGAPPSAVRPPSPVEVRRGRSTRTVWFGAAVLATMLLVSVVLWRTAAPRAEARADDPRPVLAIGRITGDSLGEAVAGILATSLARADEVIVVSNARMLELQDAFAGATGGTLRAAREAGATELIEGTLIRDGRTWRLSLSRTDVPRGTVGRPLRVEGAEVFAVVDQASAALLEGLSLAAPTASVTEVSTRSIEAWRLFQEAQQAQAAGRFDAARAQYAGALAADSNFAMAALALSRLYPAGSAEHRAALEQALRVGQRALPRDALLIRALWLADASDPRSEAVFDTLSRRYPDDLEVRMNLANPALFQHADFARAYAALVSVWNADSVRIGRTGGGRCYACEVPIHITTVAEHQDSLAIAERWLRRYLALAPNDGAAWDRLASVLERDVNRTDELAQAVQRAVRVGNTHARRLLLSAATRRGDTAAHFEAERLEPPTGPDSAASRRWNRTILYRNVGRLDDALREAIAYRAIAAMGDDSRAPASVLEAAVRMERGEARLAAALFDSIARAPARDEVEALRARRETWNRTLAATARFEAGDTTGFFALADSLAVLGLRSRYVRDHYLHHHVRGLGWLARGRMDEAIAELQRAIVFPTMGFTRSNWYLARALQAQGRRAEARQVLEAASRAPLDGAALYLSPVQVRAALRDLSR